jgi:MFS family permease
MPLGQATAAAVVFFILSLPATYMVPYLVEVEGWSVLATGFFNAGIAGSQLIWSGLLAGLVSGQDFLRLRLGPFGTMLLPGSVIAGLVICLLANGAFGLLFPIGGTFALFATFCRGSYFSLQPLGSALIGESDTHEQLGTRFTLLGLAAAIGVAAAAVVGGWLYAEHPAMPFWATSAGSIAGAIFLGVSLLVLPRVSRRPLHERNAGVAETAG